MGRVSQVESLCYIGRQTVAERDENCNIQLLFGQKAEAFLPRETEYEKEQVSCIF